MIDTNAFYKFSESRGTSGYKGAVLVIDPFNASNSGKYSLLVASTSIPSIAGSVDSFEIDLLNSPSKTSIAGKPSSEPKDVEILHHRDNAFRFHRLAGRTLDFMTVNSEFMGYKFRGTVTYRPNDASNDIWTATYTVTPMSGDMTPVFYAGDEVQETLAFSTVVPPFAKAGETLTLALAQDDATPKYELFEINKNTGVMSGTGTTLTSTGSHNVFTIPSISTGLYALQASDTGNKYASWITTVYIDGSTF